MFVRLGSLLRGFSELQTYTIIIIIFGKMEMPTHTHLSIFALCIGEASGLNFGL
jgi:hypothetical protein